MELRQLKYVVAVAREASFTRAAQSMHVTQPGLSAQIAVLEKELGQALFKRGRHGAVLTETGEAVLAHVREALAAVDRVRSIADEFSGLVRGDVRMGFVSGAADSELDIAPVLADFRRAHPGVRVRLSEDDSDAMVDGLTRGDLDVAVIGITGARLPVGIMTQVFLDVPLVAAVASESDRLPPGAVTLARIVDEPLICLPPGTGLRGVFQRACEAAGLEPDVAYEAAAPPVLLRLAAHDLGVAIVPDPHPAEFEALGIRAHPITEPDLRGQLALAWNNARDQTPATKVLLNRLRDALAANESTTPIADPGL